MMEQDRKVQESRDGNLVPVEETTIQLNLWAECTEMHNIPGADVFAKRQMQIRILSMIILLKN